MYLGNVKLGVFDCSCFDFFWSFFDYSIDENNAFRVDRRGEFVHLLAHLVGARENCLNSVGLLAQFHEYHLGSY